MSRRPIDNERKVCDAVARCLEEVTGKQRTNALCPEKEGRGAPVDYVFDLAGVLRAFEHTIVEAFEFQIRSDANFATFVIPIKESLDGRLSQNGYFKLIFPSDPCAMIAPKATANVQAAIVRWVEDIARQLVSKGRAKDLPGYLREKPSGVPFELYLAFEPGNRIPARAKGRLVVVRWAPTDYEKLRAKRIRRLFQKKLPKLAAWKAEGANTALILENTDISLTNHGLIANALEGSIAAVTQRPDEIWLVDTTLDDEWTVWRLLSGKDWFPDADNSRRYRTFEPSKLDEV